MEIAGLLQQSQEELERWTMFQPLPELRDLFERIWQEIRNARLSAGQPRSESSLHSVRLARSAAVIAAARRDRSLEISAWRMLAYSLTANEQYEDALPFYRLAIPALEQSGDHAQAARARLGFVSALSESGRYDEALQAAENAKTWLQQNHDEIGYARLCTNLANVYYRLDEHASAHRYYREAFEIFERADDRQALGQVALDLGNVVSAVDQFRESDRMYEKSEQLSLDLKLPELWSQATYNRAYLHFLRGRFAEALRGFGRLRTHFEAVGSRRHSALCDLDEAEIFVQLNLAKDAADFARRAAESFMALGLNYEYGKSRTLLGLALMQLSRPKEALENFALAQASFEREGNSYRVAVLDLCRAEVHLSLAQGLPAKALALQAGNLFESVHSASKKMLALVLLGRACLCLGETDEAERAAAEIAGIRDRADVPLLLFPYYVLRADLAAARRDMKEAERFYEQAVHDLEDHQARLHHDELRVTFLSGRNRVYEELVKLKLESPAKSDAFRDAYAWCERAKSRGLIEILSNHLPAIHTGADAAAIEKIHGLREDLNILYAKSRPELKALPSTASYQTIVEKENELAHLLRDAALSGSEFASLQQVTTETAQSITQALAPDVTLVEYFVAGDEVLAFVLSSSASLVRRRLCARDEIESIQQRLAFQLEKFRLGKAFLRQHTSQIRLATEHYLGQLFDHLIRPIAALLTTPKLIVVPHGVLHLLPFQALMDGKEYLIDRHEISYAPSASVLRYCLEKPEIHNAAPVLLGVSDEQAPMVGEEIRRIAGIYTNARTALDGAATREVFFRMARQADFIHIATHAEFRHDNPMFSGFKLSDGWVTASDLLSMNCQTNLVTLSGCKSGMSRVTESDDLMGLVRGFLYAGARCLLVSLWNVEDETTSQLMSSFYHFCRQGETKMAALSLAMRQIREEHPEPFYWAPFQLIGKA